MDKPVKPTPGPAALMVFTLRHELGLTQQALADMAGFERVEVVNLESGRNRARSARIQGGLARAFRLTAEQMGEILSGSVTPGEAVKRLRRAQAAASDAAAEMVRTGTAG